jgi:hypothetical protein
MNGGEKHMSLPLSSAALRWKRNNPWFGKHWKATMIALDIHTQILASGIEADSAEYYTLLNRQLRLALNTKKKRNK